MSKFGIIDRTLEGRTRLYFKHFTNNVCPTEKSHNHLWRKKLLHIDDPKERRYIRKMCAEDFLFYLAAFGTVFDAGDESGKPGPVPFIPYEFQVEIFTALWAAMHDDRCPARVKKPRRLGLTWACIWLFEHCWHFMSHRHLLVGSHREEEVDGSVTVGKSDVFAGEWSKLLPKVDFAHLYMPQWMLPKGYFPRQEPCRSRMKIVNPENGSIIWGTSAASRSGHGSRGYAAFWDEAAKTDNLFDIIGGLSAFAPCKLWVSTIGDLGHPFTSVLKDAPGIIQVNPEWWMNPEYSEGMTVDPDTGERTSPWLARKLAEIGNDPIIANQQYFANENKQIGGYYHPKTFEVMLGTKHSSSNKRTEWYSTGTVMEPLRRGELDIVNAPEGPIPSRFCEQKNGRWSLWFNFDKAGNPPRGTRYIIGVDISAGTVDNMGRGASNSVIAVCDWLTGELVAEYVTHGLLPADLARIACAAGKWFEGEDFAPARIIFERNGPSGAAFGKVISSDMRYPNLWRAKDEKFGWFKDGREETQRAFGLHQQLICEGRFKERSDPCVQEMTRYQFPPTGKGAPVHSAALHAEDPSGARDNHGDRVITRVLICQLLQYPYETIERDGMAPYGSYRFSRERKERNAIRGRMV